MFLKNLFKKKIETASPEPLNKNDAPKTKPKHNEKIAARKGELGEYKINIQLEQLPKDYKYLSDLLIQNPKAKTGYSQIDHVVITPYGIMVIETKNYQGTIYGGKDRKTWLVNGKFKFMNPFIQNYGHIQALKNFINSNYHNSIISFVSFTKRCTFKVDIELRKITSNELIVYDVELSEFINRKINVLKLQNKNPLISENMINKIYLTLSEANITDPKIRQDHTDGLQAAKSEASNTNSQHDQNREKCIICNTPVSENVKTYCLTNKKFKGKVYCYSHQKNIN
ncbi:nuclease-related domain-containing protein [Cytobacillus firmus]|uniref:nuclease-related domain-containing protein n=1 Tax=Cytobacillus firmus TaxID=1399 RepID=UPI0018CD2E4F|nr:nuclease-related domain-containing protein [Cytobacillus firmus]MBG9654902.1 NERD nuclease [Cytobacillus firmus]MED1907122.1 nuclease-related domain-containing protein [Cytobacillus firmus]